MMYSDTTRRLASELVETFRRGGLTAATVESCTGGLIAGAITSVGGASDIFEMGLVTYANEAKTDLVGVPAKLIDRTGAVSEEVARAMAEGALRAGPIDAAVAVTGIAGPGGGSAEKPVGLVHIAAARRGRETRHERHIFPGDRDAVRAATVDAALKLLTEIGND